MLEAFRVGPVETNEGTLTLYAACTPRGVVSALANDARTALVELRKHAPRADATCEPALADAGRPLGYRPAPLSAPARDARAVTASALWLGPTADPRIGSQLSQTLDAASRFMRERPWQHLRPEVPVAVTITLRGREHRLVVSVLGADGIEHGVALHADAEALRRFVDLVEHDRTDELRRLAARSLTIDREPTWVADTVEAAFGERMVVVPIVTDGQGPSRVTPDELSLLTAAMFAVTKLGPGRFTADVTLELGDGDTCRATAAVQDRAAVTAAPLPAWALKPIRLAGDVPTVLLTVPVLPVFDARAAMAGLRALGFEAEPADNPRIVAVRFPGLAMELVETPGTQGAGCHTVVASLPGLIAAWQAAGVPVQIVEQAGEQVALVEVPGGLNLTVADQLPHRYQPPRRRRVPRRRA